MKQDNANICYTHKYATVPPFIGRLNAVQQAALLPHDRMNVWL